MTFGTHDVTGVTKSVIFKSGENAEEWISERLIKYFYLSESQHWTQPSTFCWTVYSFCCFWRTVFQIQENSASGGKRSHSVTLFTGFVKLTFTVGAGGHTLVWTNSYLPGSPHLLRLSFMMRIVPEFLAREHDDMLKRERVISVHIRMICPNATSLTSLRRYLGRIWL